MAEIFIKGGALTLTMGKFSDNPRAQVLIEHLEFLHGAVAIDDVESKESTVIKAANEQGFRLLKTEYMSYTVGHVAGEGPIVYGLAGPAISAAQIEEAVETTPTGGKNVDPTDSFFSNRPVWILGMHLLLTAIGFEDRFLREKKINWSFPEGTGLSFWVWSPNAALAGGQTNIIMKHFGVWLND